MGIYTWHHITAYYLLSAYYYYYRCGRCFLHIHPLQNVAYTVQAARLESEFLNDYTRRLVGGLCHTMTCDAAPLSTSKITREQVGQNARPTCTYATVIRTHLVSRSGRGGEGRRPLQPSSPKLIQSVFFCESVEEVLQQLSSHHGVPPVPRVVRAVIGYSVLTLFVLVFRVQHDGRRRPGMGVAHSVLCLLSLPYLLSSPFLFLYIPPIVSLLIAGERE